METVPGTATDKIAPVPDFSFAHGNWRIRQLCPSNQCYPMGIRVTAQQLHLRTERFPTEPAST